MKTYSELITLPTFEDRFKYLKIGGGLGEDTFGFDRYLNQVLYRSPEWRQIRNEIIVRDNGCDLACLDREIVGTIIVHHMNPITKRDILERSDLVFDANYLISSSLLTHNAIHYADESILFHNPVERYANDTCPWR